MTATGPQNIKPKAYPQGSEWRKWDLQVQTRLDKDYACFGGATLSREQLDALIAATGLTEAEITAQEKSVAPAKYAKLFIRYIDLFTDMDVVAITDHNTGEELDFIIKEAESSKRKISIIPGVEVSSNHGIHLLCLFDPLKPWRTTWKDSIDHFLTEIGLTGQRFNAQGQPTDATATSQDIFKKVEGKGGICVCAHIGTQNGLFYHSSTANGGTAHSDIYKHSCCQIVQLPHTATISNGVGNIINGRDPQYGNKSVAQIKCSDARKLVDVGCRFVWIKANPTFEGLRQIIFEPTERVKIQDDKPEPKSPYFVIDKIRFVDNTGKNDFLNTDIPLNQNLTAVIGGKSTGKSLLLHYIAKTIDREEVSKAVALGDNESVQDYSFDDDVNFDFEVVWKDGEKTSLQKAKEDEETERRKIIFIPQHYLNLLSEKEIQSRQTLNLFVQNIILEDEGAAQYQEGKNLEISKTEKEISKEINNLFSIEEDIARLNEEIKNAGDEKGVLNYIDQLKKQIDAIKEKTGLSKEDIEKYGDLVEKIKTIEESTAHLVQDKKYITEFGGELKTNLDTTDLVDEYESYITDEEVKKQVSEQYSFLKKIKGNVEIATKKAISFVDEKIGKNNEAIAGLKKELAPLLSAVQMQTELAQKQQLLKNEEVKLNGIQIKRKNLLVKKKTFDSKKETILKLYKDIFSLYEDLQSEFKKYSNRLQDIDLNIVVGFKDTEFNKDVVEDYLNKGDLKKLADPIASWNEELKYTYNPQNHLQFVASVVDGILTKKVKTVKGRTQKDALLKLLENRFYTDFKIAYKNDSLDKMSPGKKGLVLLKILIDLSNEKWPIIIDQPEDDLDNRSVYTDLVAFIKLKKKDRQIIVATHNPNLVVGSDADEVIVANQHGQEVGRDKARYKFEYVSGALEDSFKDDSAVGILNKMGIRQHVCDILEGGEEAFQKREQKYGF